MRETTAAPGSALAAATELVLLFLDDDELHPACELAGVAGVLVQRDGRRNHERCTITRSEYSRRAVVATR